MRHTIEAAVLRVEAISVIQGDAVPQRFIPKLIDLYRNGLFPLTIVNF